MTTISKLIVGVLGLTLVGGIALVAALAWFTLNPPPAPPPQSNLIRSRWARL